MWRNNSSAFPVGGQSCGPRSCRWGSAGCLDLVVWLKSSSLSSLGGSVQAKWCEAPSCIFRSGGPTMTFWPMLRNEKQSGQIFKHDLWTNLRTKRQKQNDAMFYLSRRSILASSQLGSKTYEWYDFFSSNAKYGSIDKMDGILVPNESFK